MTKRLTPFLLAIIIPAILAAIAAVSFAKQPVVSALKPETWSLLAVAVACVVMMLIRAGRKESFVWLVLVVLAFGLASYAQWQHTIASVVLGVLAAVGAFLLLSWRGKGLLARVQKVVQQTPKPSGGNTGGGQVQANILEQIKVGLGGGAATVDVANVINRFAEYSTNLSRDTEVRARQAEIDALKLARELTVEGHFDKDEFAAKARETLKIPTKRQDPPKSKPARIIGASGFPGIGSTRNRGKGRT